MCVCVLRTVCSQCGKCVCVRAHVTTLRKRRQDVTRSTMTNTTQYVMCWVTVYALSYAVAHCVAPTHGHANGDVTTRDNVMCHAIWQSRCHGTSRAIGNAIRHALHMHTRDQMLRIPDMLHYVGVLAQHRHRDTSRNVSAQMPRHMP